MQRVTNILNAALGIVTTAVILFSNSSMAQGVYPEGRNNNAPAHPRTEVRSASRIRTCDPAVAPQHHIFGRGVILVGNDTGAQPEQLCRSEGFRTGDEVRRQPPGEEVAGRAGNRKTQQRENEGCPPSSHPSSEL